MNHRAIFGLSYCLAIMDDLKRQEPAIHTRRYRELTRMEIDVVRLLDTYPSPPILPGTELHRLACEVFDAMDSALKGGADTIIKEHEEI